MKMLISETNIWTTIYAEETAQTEDQINSDYDFAIVEVDDATVNYWRRVEFEYEKVQLEMREYLDKAMQAKENNK